MIWWVPIPDFLLNKRFARCMLKTKNLLLRVRSSELMYVFGDKMEAAERFDLICFSFLYILVREESINPCNIRRERRLRRL